MLYYKGVGVGTFLYPTDLRIHGLQPRNPGGNGNMQSLMTHVARATTVSPFISLTRSYGVARDYAIDASRTRPTAARPAYVYELDIDDQAGLQVFDPVCEVARHNNNPYVSPSYHHDGAQTFVLGVVDPGGLGAYLTAPAPRPKVLAGGTVRPPNLSIELETMVRALRDAEIIVFGNISPSYVSHRYNEP